MRRPGREAPSRVTRGSDGHPRQRAAVHAHLVAQGRPARHRRGRSPCRGDGAAGDAAEHEVRGCRSRRARCGGRLRTRDVSGRRADGVDGLHGDGVGRGGREAGEHRRRVRHARRRPRRDRDVVTGDCRTAVVGRRRPVRGHPGCGDVAEDQIRRRAGDGRRGRGEHDEHLPVSARARRGDAASVGRRAEDRIRRSVAAASTATTGERAAVRAVPITAATAAVPAASATATAAGAARAVDAATALAGVPRRRHRPRIASAAGRAAAASVGRRVSTTTADGACSAAIATARSGGSAG